MGVPDFLKFVARSAPGALCRVPRGSQASLLVYDYVLVDATNAAQTIGLESLEKFLKQDNIVVRKAIIFALDAQRNREGTSRSQRQTNIMVGDLDVKVQKLCVSLVEYFRQRAQHQLCHAAPVPLVLMSGRNVAGEADYKVLDIHRAILAASLEHDETTLPHFLFISEDSDILCGTLCGPAPQQVSIATNLHDTTFEIGILQLEHVLAYVAVCADALVAAHEEEGNLEVKEDPMAELQDAPVERQKEHQTPKTPADDSVVRRKKPDGPMIATGTRIALTDSDEDGEDEEHCIAKTCTASIASQPASGSAPKATSMLTSLKLSAGQMIHATCVDLVFLFVVVMGNGVNVPPLVRGVTRVDIESCWNAYCSKKFNNPQGEEEKEHGKVLLSTSSQGGRTAARDGQGSLTLDCRFLHSILESVHYADALSRPPVEEEKNRAIVYLSNAVYATLRYIVGCNLNAGATVTETFLDSRVLSETDVLVPNLAAVLWVLSRESKRIFHYPLYGLAKKELLAVGGNAVSDESAVHGVTGPAQGRSNMQLDVTEALVAPGASSWAVVRGAGTRTYNLRTIINAKTPAELSAASSSSRRGAAQTMRTVSTGTSLKAYASSHRGGGASVVNVFTALGIAWRRSVALGVPRLRALASHDSFVSPVSGNVVEGPLSSHVPAAVEGTGASQPKHVYSFELRRMAPVLVEKTPQPPTASDGHPVNEKAPTPKTSEMQAALLKALGVSLDYGDAHAPAPAEARQPRIHMDSEDRAEMSRLMKVAKRERSSWTKETEGRDKRRSKAEVFPAGGTTKDAAAGKHGEDGKSGKFKRPGKKERLRRQQERQAGVKGMATTTPQE